MIILFMVREVIVGYDQVKQKAKKPLTKTNIRSML